MYKIMLVDDEHIELDTLQRFVPWEEMGFTLAGTAKNGREALSRMEEWSPDIVLTDVRMPIMDGIQFAKAARKRWPRLILVFMSGYDDFAYVKSALMLEASGYLLKPLDMDELKEQMGIVRQKCADEERSRRSSRALASQYAKRLLQEERHPSPLEDGLPELLRELVPGASGAYSVALVTIDTAHKPADDPTDSGTAANKVLQRLQQLADNGQALIFEWQEERLIVLTAPGETHLAERFHEEAAKICPWTTTCVYPEPVALDQVREISLHLLHYRGRHASKHGSGRFVVSTPAPSGGTDRHAATVHRVKSLIDLEYGTALTIEDLAEFAYLSPNHLRTLFKEHTGYTVLEYMTKVRIERASELLRDTDIKIHEIATHVGYESASHFCSVFHKKRGLTPNQYRNRQAASTNP